MLGSTTQGVFVLSKSKKRQITIYAALGTEPDAAQPPRSLHVFIFGLKQRARESADNFCPTQLRPKFSKSARNVECGKLQVELEVDVEVFLSCDWLCPGESAALS